MESFLLFGAGPFALGGALGSSSLGDVDIHLFVRTNADSADSRRTFQTLAENKDVVIRSPSNVERVALSTVNHYDDDGGRLALNELLVGQEATSLVVTSVKDGQAGIAAELKRVLLNPTRANLPPLLILPFENEVDEVAWSELASAAGLCREVWIARSMVDRMCTNRRVDQSGAVVVDVEVYREVAVELPVIKNSSLLRPYASFIEDYLQVTIVDDVATLGNIKKFLMNGVQMCFATYALYHLGFDQVLHGKTVGTHEFLETVPGAAELLYDISREYEFFLVEAGFDPIEVAERADTYRQRIATTPDSARRVLNRVLSGPRNTAISIVDKRIGPALNMLSELSDAGGSRVADCFDILQELILVLFPE